MGLHQKLQALRNYLKAKHRNQRPKSRGYYRPTLDRLEDRTLPSITYTSAFFGAIVQPTPSGADALTLTETSSGLQSTLNGQSLVFPPGFINSISVNLGDGNDTINVEGTVAGDPVAINLGSGFDSVNISPTAKNLDNIRGNVTITGGLGFDTLNVNDQNNATTVSYTMTASSVTRSNAATIGYSVIDVVNINGGSGTQNSYNIYNTESIFTTTLNIGGPSYVGGSVGVANTGSYSTLNLTGAPAYDTDLAATGSGSTTNINYAINGGRVLLGNGNVQGSGSVQNILGTVNIISTIVFLQLGDISDSGSHTVTVTDASIDGLAPGNINYGGFIDSGYDTFLRIFGSTGGSTWNVQSTRSPVLTSIICGGNDTINVGDANGMQDIRGVLGARGPVSGVSSSITVNLNDQADTAGRTVTVTSGTADFVLLGGIGATISGLAPANIDLDVSTAMPYVLWVTDLNINGGSGHNTFNVLATTVPTTTINSNATDTVNVGDANGVQDIQGTLNVNSRYIDAVTLNLNDQPDTTGRAVIVTNASVSGLAPAPINYGQFSLSNLNINGGSGSNTFNVLSTEQDLVLFSRFGYSIFTTTTTINASAGNDTVNVGNANNSTDGILGTLIVNGQGGTNTLNVNDQGNSTGRQYLMNPTYLLGLSAPIYFSSMATLTLNAGSGNDTLTVVATATGTAVSFNGGAGANTLVGPNAANTWSITSLNGGAVGAVAFSSVQNLIGGSSSDTFRFNGGAITGKIDGGAGTNTVDYSAYPGDIVVDLPLGVATAVGGGIANIENVIGSIGNDLIVGDANPNVLNGGTGRNIIIGGAGSDNIAGGGGDNILIGGATLWDTNLTALQAIMQEWTNLNLTFNQRVNALSAGIIVNNQTYALNTNTVFPDNSPESLIGGPGHNWFFFDFDDSINPGGSWSNDWLTYV